MNKKISNSSDHCCHRCQATTGLRLESSLTVWNSRTMETPEQRNTYVCIDRKACSERINEATGRIKEADLWANYHRDRRPRRYTPRKYWRDGRRLTFEMARVLFLQHGLVLEKGQPDFPHGLKSGYIINREWRFTSLLEAIKLIEPAQPQKAGRLMGVGRSSTGNAKYLN